MDSTIQCFPPTNLPLGAGAERFRKRFMHASGSFCGGKKKLKHLPGAEAE